VVAAVDTETAAARPDPAPLRLGHQPALDGLRGLAVAIMLLFHAGFRWAHGGFISIDVFFVMSGFLITWLLVAEWEKSGTIAVGGFYGRRLRRLGPAMVVFMAGVAVYAVTLAPAVQLRDLRGDFLATVAYVTNWRFIAEGRSYFDAFAAPSPLTHTWSLAVEEQWYLIWPVLITALLRWPARRPRRLTAPILVATGLCLASACWTVVLAGRSDDPSRAHFGTDTRAQELLAGAVLAMVCHRVGSLAVPARLRRLVDLAGLAGLGWILWLSATITEQTLWVYRGGMVLLSLASVAIVLAAVQPAGLTRGFLSRRPLRYFGQISYGLYLYHYPLFLVLSSSRTGLHGNALLIVRMAVTTAVAAASLSLVERPVRERRLPGLPVLAASGTVLAVSVFAVLALTPTAAGPAFPTGAPSEPTADGPGPANVAGGDPFQYVAAPAPVLPPGDPRLRVLVTGDSVALTLSLAYDGDNLPELLWDRSSLGCQLFAGERVVNGQPFDGGPQCAAGRADRDRWIREFRPEVVLVLSGVWEVYDKQVDGRRLDFGTPEYDAWFSENLDRLVGQLSASGGRVVFLTALCNDRLLDITETALPENDEARVDHVNDLYREAVARQPDRAGIIDLHAKVCPGGKYVSELDGRAVRDDGVHFTPEGADLVLQWLGPQVRSLAPPRPPGS
jgi:peptidoglycan/LPS O-acetylase OafA/YrhL